MRLTGALVVALGGCLVENPAFDGVDGDAAGATTTSTSSGSGLVTSTSGGTSSGATSGTAATTSGDGVTTSGGGVTATASGTTGAFDPMTLRPYEAGSCIEGPYCHGGMGEPVPALIEALECFAAPVDPPLTLRRIGFEVRHIVAQPTANLQVLPFDVLNHAPVFMPIESRTLGIIDQPMVYRSFELDPPVLLDTRDFCVLVSGGGDTSTLAVKTDQVTMSPGDAFLTMDDPGGFCEIDLTNLRDWYGQPFAHFCIDVEIGPP